MNDESTEFGLKLFSQSSSGGNAKKPTEEYPCGATVTIDAQINVTGKDIETVNLSFDGSIKCTNGNPNNKEGKISFKLISGKHWNQAGTKIAITYQNYKEYKGKDLITINGTKYITNVSGGVLENLVVGSEIEHHIQATGISFVFKDGKTWIEKYFPKLRNLKKLSDEKNSNKNSNEVSISGNGVYSSFNNVAVWGSHNGQKSIVIYNQPKVYNSCSGKGKYIKGESHFYKGNESDFGNIWCK